MISTYFIFNGIKSIDMGLHNVKIESGLTSVPWTGGKEIIEEKIRYNRNPIFYGVQNQPIQFTVTFSLLEEKMTDEKKIELARWLFLDEYAEFQTTDYLGKCIHVIAINQIDFMTADNELGYFTVEFRANSSTWFSKPFVQPFDLRNNETSTIIEVQNKSNVEKIHYPELEFEMFGSENLILRNLSNGGKEFKFTDIHDDEKIYVNNQFRQVISEKPYYRLGNFNKNWLGLTYGTNRIEVIGKCYLRFRSKFPLYM